MIDLLLSFLAGLAAAAVGSVAGGGGAVIEFFTLVALGMPIQAALATKRLGGIGLYPTSIYNFHKAKKVVKDALPAVITLGILGGALGTFLVVSLSERVIELTVAALLSIILVFLYIRKDIGTLRKEKSPFWSPAYFLAALYGGFFGSAGPPSITVLAWLRGLKHIEAAATFFVGNFFLALTSLTVFISTGLIDYTLASAMFIGNLLGGWIGSRTAIKRGDKWAKTALLLVILATIIKLIFF